MTLRIQEPSAWMGATAVGLSALGLVVHTVREFGYARLAAPETGTVPIVAVQVVLFIVWWRVSPTRPLTALALVATGLLLLVGGAILSILPLPFLPFVPEQTVSHYVSHVIFGITQIPLILVMLKARTRGEAFPGVRL